MCLRDGIHRARCERASYEASPTTSSGGPAPNAFFVQGALQGHRPERLASGGSSIGEQQAALLVLIGAAKEKGR